MATFFKNPNLPDYFLEVPEINIATPPKDVRSYVPEYEDAKVLYFPNLKPSIDFDFWARLPIDQGPGFKKMVCYVDDLDQEAMVDRALRKISAPQDLYRPLLDEMSRLFKQIMPIYYRIFGGYEFSKKRTIWRLNLTRNENLHFDTYKEEYPEHFARMFINLDNQPRIWHTSYTTDQIYEKFGDRVPKQKLATITNNRFWRELTIAAFRDGVFDREPRHMVYFDPGDVWVVDSRQVAHQIYYGRRAVSIDFDVPLKCMRDTKKHYLHMAAAFRNELMGVTGGTLQPSLQV